MHLSSTTARFVLGHTTDPAQAAAMADLLGISANATPCKVAFPPDWVRTKQRGPVDLAAYAVENCDDPDTLDIIIATARRKTILLALARNRHISDAGLRDLCRIAADTADTNLRGAIPERGPALAATPELRFTDLLDDIDAGELSWTHKWQILRRLNQVALPLPTELADRALRAMAYAGENWGVAKVLTARLIQDPPGMDEANTEYFATTHYSIIELLDMLPGGAEYKVLHAFLADVRPDDVPVVPLPLALTRRITELFEPDKFLATVNKGRWYQVDGFFDDESIEFLAGDKHWCEVLIQHELDNDQLARLAATLAEYHHPARLLDRRPLTREALELVFANIAPGTFRESDLAHQLVLERLTGPSDPLLEQYLTVAEPWVRVLYLRGAWSQRPGAAIVPSVDEVHAAFDANPDRVDFASAACGYDTRKHPEQAIILADRARGFAWNNLVNKEIGAHVFARLTATGAVPELVFPMFDEQGPNASLDQLCDSLTRLAKLQD